MTTPTGTDETASPSHLSRRVLLYSGGLDSYCAAYVWRPEVLLYVDMGTGYALAERARLGKLRAADVGAEQQVTVKFPLAQYERPDHIIPLRNLLLAALGAQYGERVALAATAGDRVLDKSFAFAERASNLLSWLWQPQHWTEGKSVTLELPVKHLSKAALVRAAMEAGANPVRLGTDTFSCYTPTRRGKECGACKPCARKWVALMAAGAFPAVDARPYVEEHYVPAIEQGTWDRGADEAADVRAALDRAAAVDDEAGMVGA